MANKKALLAFAIVSGCAGRTTAPVTAPAIVTQPVIKVAPEEAEPEEIKAEEPKPEEAATPVIEEEEVPVSEEIPITTLSLCEPINERWKYPTKEEKKQIRALIQKTCTAMGVGREDCKFFLSIVSVRESDYRPWVRHKLSGDVSAALSSYLSRSHAYGWTVLWPKAGRKQEDLSKIEYTPRGDAQDPYFLDPERWMYGLGLGGINISYHLRKFDHVAPPEILCDTVINVMIQVTIARNAVRKYRAKNFAEIQAIYGGRTYYDGNGRARPLSCSRGCPKHANEAQRRKARKGDATILKRCRARGLDCHKTPQLGSKLKLREMTPAERYEAAEKIRGEALPPFDTPPENEIKKKPEGKPHEDPSS